MKIKAVEIAKQLGISKATVSLALNNKPGVSNETKKQILEYVDRVENGLLAKSESNVIKVIYFSKKFNILYNSEIDLWSGVLAQISQEAKRDGFSVAIDYVDGNSDEEIKKTIIDCNDKSVVGVVLFALEMQLNDFLPFKNINKPLIVYDNDFNDDDYSYVMIDNFKGVASCLEYLKNKGYEEIVYFANSDDNFNFIKRRDAYFKLLNNYSLKGEMIVCGNNVESIYTKVKNDLSEGIKYKAIICENYQVSIGTIKAFYEENVEIGSEVMMIGIDEIPDYFCYGYKLTTLKVSHNQRAFMTMMLLKKEIMTRDCDKFRLYSACKLQVGNT